MNVRKEVNLYMEIDRKDYEFLLSMSWCLIDDGFSNYTIADVRKLERIEKRYAEPK